MRSLWKTYVRNCEIISQIIQNVWVSRIHNHSFGIVHRNRSFELTRWHPQILYWPLRLREKWGRPNCCLFFELPRSVSQKKEGDSSPWLNNCIVHCSHYEAFITSHKCIPASIQIPVSARLRNHKTTQQRYRIYLPPFNDIEAALYLFVIIRSLHDIAKFSCHPTHLSDWHMTVTLMKTCLSWWFYVSFWSVQRRSVAAKDGKT